MQSKIIKVFAISTLSFLLFNCREDPDFPAKNVQGYKPIYTTSTEGSISFVAARSIYKPGKILRYQNYLLINEVKSGIHFYDNSDPSSPKRLGFLKIEGNVDMTVKDNVLYADYLNSVVAINISDLSSVKELARTTVWSLIVPPEPGYYFECVDTARGEVSGWNKVNYLSNPQCYR